jgi:hypothetical protein
MMLLLTLVELFTVKPSKEHASAKGVAESMDYLQCVGAVAPYCFIIKHYETIKMKHKETI